MSSGCEAFYDELVAKLLTLGRGPVAGLSDAEIEQVRADQEVSTLPVYYEHFLRRLGRQSGALLVGTDILYPDILGLKQDAADLLQENRVKGFLPGDSVVFAMHQGYEFYWLRAGDVGNPRVFMYSELRPSEIREWPSFSDFLLHYLNDMS